MGVNDTNYASTLNLTALASQGVGLSANGVRQKDLVATLSEIETNFNAILAKLDADGGVNDADFAAIHAVDLNDTVVGSKGLGQGFIVSFLDSFITNFNGTLTKLDSDTGVTDIDYNSTLAITDVVNAGKERNTAVDNAGMGQGALYTLLATIVTNVNALNAKLDDDD
jgi:hypothetical protein